MGYREKLKRVTGRKEKVAKLVDKSTRFVDKCLSHKRAFADKPAGLPSQRLRYTSILEMIAGFISRPKKEEPEGSSFA